MLKCDIQEKMIEVCEKWDCVCIDLYMTFNYCTSMVVVLPNGRAVFVIIYEYTLYLNSELEQFLRMNKAKVYTCREDTYKRTLRSIKKLIDKLNK